jgi:sRNA-binding protein
MNREFIPEKQLQNWFVDAANNNRLGDAIQNREALKKRLLELQSTARTTDAVSMDGIARALRICELLDEADKLSADRSVALPGYNQMRPDLVLFTSSAHYLLVELKTQPGPERQGIQELLA